MVNVGGSNRIPQTEWLVNKYLFLTVLEAGKSKIKMPGDWVSAEGPLPGSWTVVFPSGPHNGEQARKPTGVPFMRVLIPLPNYLSKTPVPNTICLGARILTYEWGGGTQTLVCDNPLL